MSPSGEALLAGLADRSLPPAQFSHEAHVRVAWELLQQGTTAEAEARFCALILGYVEALGAEAKFHRTLSIALVRLIAAQSRPGEVWAVFQIRAERLFRDARGLLAEYYSAARLAEGRTVFVEPDLKAFP